MKPERICGIRDMAANAADRRYADAFYECLDEIERLQKLVGGVYEPMAIIQAVREANKRAAEMVRNCGYESLYDWKSFAEKLAAEIEKGKP